MVGTGEDGKEGKIQVNMSTLSGYNLRTLVDLFNHGNIKIPPFQRGDVWSKTQRRMWAETVAKGDRLPGMISLYTLPDNVEVLWCADGWQRLTTTVEMATNARKFGLEPKDVDAALLLTHIAVSVAPFEDHHSGYREFRHLNVGMIVDVAEYMFGVMALHERGSILAVPNGSPTLTQHLRADELMLQVAGRKLGPSGRIMKHKLDRDSWALMWEFLNEYPLLRDWNDLNWIKPNPSLDPEKEFTAKQAPIEVALTKYLDKQKMSPAEIEKSSIELRSWVGKTTTRIKGILDDVKESHGIPDFPDRVNTPAEEGLEEIIRTQTPMSPATWRTFLHWYMLAKNKGNLSYGDVDDVVHVLADYVAKTTEDVAIRSGIALDLDKRQDGVSRFTFYFGDVRQPLRKIKQLFPETNPKLLVYGESRD